MSSSNRFGWFGFNGGSVSYFVGHSRVAARAMVMTAVAGGASGLAGTIISYVQEGAIFRRQIDLSTTLNSILAGLVGITANCATVQLEGAFVIGVGSAAVYVYAARLQGWCRIDDVVQAVPVRLCLGAGLVIYGLCCNTNLQLLALFWACLVGAFGVRPVGHGGCWFLHRSYPLR